MTGTEPFASGCSLHVDEGAAWFHQGAVAEPARLITTAADHVPLRAGDLFGRGSLLGAFCDHNSAFNPARLMLARLLS